MPDDELLKIQPVHLNTPIKSIISRAGVRVNCETCGEEIINEREVILDGRILCQPCAYGGTNSVWNIFGLAVSGKLEGKQLAPVVSINHFWFSWAAFKPETRIYLP